MPKCEVLEQNRMGNTKEEEHGINTERKARSDVPENWGPRVPLVLYSIECPPLLTNTNSRPICKCSFVCCRRLHEVFRCVGTKLPMCLLKIEKSYRKYRQTPYDCHTTRAHTQELQGYMNSIVCDTTDDSKTNNTPKDHSINMTYELHVSDRNGYGDLRGKRYMYINKPYQQFWRIADRSAVIKRGLSHVSREIRLCNVH